MGYDIIGDIHGQFEKLESLLTRLGYRQRQGAWRHPDRSAIFVGDFIDRGSRGVETVQTVRAMVDAGSALAVMGNHELNAIAWHTPDPRDPGEYLRPRLREPWGAKNRGQHKDFLAQVEDDPALHAELVSWFLTLPLWLDLEGVRVVHACWHAPFIDWLAPQLREGRFLTPELLIDATTEPANPAEKDTAAPSIFKAVEALTKGLEMPLPASHHFRDKDDNLRDRVRVRWWDVSGVSLRDLALLPDSERLTLPDLSAPAHIRLGAASDKLTFFGHYWMKGEPGLQSDAAVCVDYSAGKGGPLVAYRWDQGAPCGRRPIRDDVLSRGVRMATAKKINHAARRRLTTEAQLQSWEQEFRADFARDGGAQFEPLLQRFGIRTGAQEMLEGTIDFVTACAAFASMDGVEIGALLADQRYDGQPSSATYALTFDLFGRSSARLLVKPEMKSIDLADIYEYPWERLRMAGYGDFWVSRLDGEDLSMEEIEELDRVVSGDIWFDYSEDEVSIIFDPDTYAGALAITVYEQIEDTPDTEAPEA